MKAFTLTCQAFCVVGCWAGAWANLMAGHLETAGLAVVAGCAVVVYMRLCRLA